ncbi:MAG: hypothetical protein M0R73_13430 [Dehalococcoidia bacterium]|nr:hypothetical protein [Dehalococcoidia bacterium]
MKNKINLPARKRTVEWTIQTGSPNTLLASGGGWHVTLSDMFDDGVFWGITERSVGDCRYHYPQEYTTFVAGLSRATAMVEEFIQRNWGVMPIASIDGLVEKVLAKQAA